ncbi:MAG: magnesium/cobalt transporter CorA [Acidobacteriota bacterium]
MRQRLRTSKGQIRSSGADYLAYSILDAIVDQYFPVLEAMSEQLDVLEDEVLEDPESRTVSRIHEVRRDLLMLRRAIWPLREAVNSLLRDSESYFSEDTRLFLRDLYDHTIQVMDLIESFREVGAGLVDVYLSSVSNRMNEVMKVLTMIATIFIPLSFIAGLYGMNFNPAKSPFNMPELNWYFGYPFAVGLMALVALGMLWFFKRKRWF